MKQLSVVLLCLFCIFFIMAPLAGAITSRRRTRHLNAAEPGPKQLQRAQRKLSTVTACSTLRGPPNPDRNATGSRGKPEGDDVEATAAQLEMGECPICIGPLMPEPALVNGRNIRGALDELATATERTRRKKRLSVRRKLSCMSGEAGDEDPAADEEVADDILTLNVCGHVFHSRCLASWFLMDRFDCPMCRVQYYTRPHPASRSIVISTMYMAPGGRVMGLG